MASVAALTAGHAVPSARFRVRQHIPSLALRGIDVLELPAPIGKNVRLPGRLRRARGGRVAPLLLALLAARVVTRVPGVLRSRGFDATWLNRELVNGCYGLESLLKPPVVLDVDDAIWVDRPYVERLARRADVVIAGNAFLADWFSRRCPNVHVVPTAVDTRRYGPAPPGRDDGCFRVGWTGTRDNLRALYGIEAGLHRFLRLCPSARLRVICDEEPRFQTLNAGQVEFVPWSRATEVSGLQSLSVGIMPLPDTAWARGKCSFKMLQYMSLGVPVVASPVGMNAEILDLAEVGLAATTPGDWCRALSDLQEDPEARARMGSRGRRVVEARFSLDVVGEQIVSVFRTIL